MIDKLLYLLVIHFGWNNESEFLMGINKKSYTIDPQEAIFFWLDFWK